MKNSRRSRSGASKVVAAPATFAQAMPSTTSHATHVPSILALEKWRDPLAPPSPGRPRRSGASLAKDCVVVFRLAAPRARSVRLAADFTEWEKYALSLQQAGDGEWEVRVSLSPGQYGYRFLVDGQWQDDPRCQRQEPNPFGTANSVAEIC
jgi:hypothetical protein